MTKKSKIFIALSISAALGAGALFFLREPDESASRDSRASLPLAPDFKLEDAEGRSVRLSEFKGRPVVLHFWASWCPPCLEEIGYWVEATKRHRELPLQFVAVSLDKTWEAAEKILPRGALGKNAVSLLDPKMRVADSFGSYEFPETYVIGPDRRILMKWVGPQEWDSPRIHEALEKLSSLARPEAQ